MVKSSFDQLIQTMTKLAKFNLLIENADSKVTLKLCEESCCISLSHLAHAGDGELVIDPAGEFGLQTFGEQYNFDQHKHIFNRTYVSLVSQLVCNREWVE